MSDSLEIDAKLLQPRVPGDKLTQKDNADSGVQFITPVGPRQSLLLAMDPTSICENLLYPLCTCPNTPPQIPWDLQRNGKYSPNNPIIHVSRAQTVKQLADNQ